MNIALMANDKKKQLMVQFCTAYRAVLAKHSICATSSTGRQVTEATGLPISLLLSRALGGSQQVAARIAYSEIDMVLFFCDPDDSEQYANLIEIIQLCDKNNVPIATNVATAEMLVLGLQRGDLDWREITKSGSSII